MSFDTVQEAAKELDAKYPGWEKRITQELIMSAPSFCVLGQIGGDYYRGCKVAGIVPYSQDVFDRDKYKAEWTEEIRLRREKKETVKVKKPYILYQIAECGSWAGEGLYPSEQQFLAEAALQARIHCDNNGIDRIVVVPFSAKPYTIEKNGWVEVR